MTVLLGGDANPLGAVVQFLEASTDSVVGALHASFTARATDGTLPDVLASLLPFESPWSRILAAPCGGWTAVVNNGLHGGDSTAPGPALGHTLGVRCVVACAVPRYGPGHEQTQLEVSGPAGEPPLMYERSISATATDGRWEWYDWGRPFDFERTDRYTARRERDRFDRPLLLEYLVRLGIRATDDSSYGRAVLLEDRDRLDRRRVSLQEARADFR